jgi:hypothetical protein
VNPFDGSAPAVAPGPGPLPRWFLLLPVFAIACWWPLEPYWQSDDFVAVHYAQDLGRALADFAGPQYGSTDIWLFYRPLITLSFWLDQVLGGGAPFVSHLSNVLAHGASALLAGVLWRRFLSDGRAFLAGALWAALPSHAGSLAWAVGRVDSHTAVWCLLCLWLAVRQRERDAAGERAPRWPAVAALLGALLSKELALAVPPLATLLAFALPGPSSPRERAAAAWRGTWPLWAALAAYVAFRLLVLGQVGGYTGAQVLPAAIAEGLLRSLADLVVPVRWTGGELLDRRLGALPWPWLCAAAVLPAALHPLWTRRAERLLLPLLAFLVATAPIAVFLAGAENVHNLRLFYLPSVALAGLLAAPGPLPALLALATLAAPLWAMRQEQFAADRDSAARHAAILREVRDGAGSPMFVAGLPHTNARGTAVQFHFGVDRMTEPPFGPGGVRLFALRPFAELPGIHALAAAGDPPFALPGGSTWFFADATALGRAPADLQPELVVQGDAGGVLDLTEPRLLQLAGGDRGIALVTPGVRGPWYRLTIFTATGYFACFVPDHAGPGAGDGRIEILRFFGGDRAARIAPEVHAPSRFGATGDMFALLALEMPTTLDLVPEFPVLLEAGQAHGTAFTTTHRARRLLTFRFDRRFPAIVRLALPDRR